MAAKGGQILKYTIGVYSMSVALRPLLENRLPIQGKFTKDIRLGEQEGRFLTVELSGRQALFVLSDILADIIVEHLQIRYLMAELAREYGYLSERERSGILVCTVRKLWYGGGKERLEQKKKDISGRVLACLLEGEGTLALDGVLRFRMKDCVAKWKQTLQECARQAVLLSERKQFIKLLRYFVCMRDPAIRYVQVQREGEAYILLDEQGNRIQVTAEDAVDATKEDLLLSGLLDLSPEVIDLGSVCDGELKGLLADIFVGRVRK